VHALARHLVRDEALAEDLAQETLLHALASPARPHSGVRSWLGGILAGPDPPAARPRARRSTRVVPA